MISLGMEGPLNRYVIDANFYPMERIDIAENIVFNNNSNKKLAKIYLYLSSKDITINSITRDKEKLPYKIIGKNQDILMVILDEPLKVSKSTNIRLEASINLSEKNNENEGIYLFNNWYPIIAKIDNGFWDINVNSLSILDGVKNGNYSLNISMPVDYRLSSIGEVKDHIIIGSKRYYNIEGFNIKYLPIIIESINFNIVE